MKPLTVIASAIGIATVTGIVLSAKKAKAATPEPAPTYGETDRIALPVPSGWRRVTNADIAAAPDLIAHANALRNTSGFTSMQYGTLSSFVASDGKTYATWIEQHYHEPGGAAKPWGLHHGVTLLAKAEVGVGLAGNETWFIWWVERDFESQWFGPRLLSDEAVWRFEYDVERGTPGVRRLYRWFWDGSNWQYDTRSAEALYVRAGQQRYASWQ